jgi:hypothetical protein
MTQAISGIDHLVVAVPDLEAARAEFEGLGFQVTPRGRHEQFGTANYLIILNDSYIELLAVENSAAANRISLDIMEPCLAKGGGIPMIALATDDARESHKLLIAAHLQATEPQTWSRPAQTPDGNFTASFTTFFMQSPLLPGITAFFTQHHSIEHVRHRAWRVHANRAERLIGIIFSGLATPNALVPILAQAQVEGDPGAHHLQFGAHFIRYDPSADLPTATVSIAVDGAQKPQTAHLATVANITIEFCPSTA